MKIRDRESTENIIIGATYSKNTETLSEWVLSLPDRDRGVFGCGFHYAIQPDGDVTKLRDAAKWGNFPPNLEPYNHNSILIRLVGDPEIGFQKEQHESLTNLLALLKDTYEDALPLYIW